MKITLRDRMKTEIFNFELEYNGKPTVISVEVEDNHVITVWYDYNDEGHQHDLKINDVEDLEVATGLLRELRKIRKGIK